MMRAGEQYLSSVVKVIERIADTQMTTIQLVGTLVGRSVVQGGIVHLFGAGHSHMVAEEVFIRAGTLAAVRAIWPQQISTKFERAEGLGSCVLALGDVREGEVLFVISNSGINPLPLDVALEGRKRGATTVGVGSKAHSESVNSRHSSGKRLLDVCDYFLDTCVPAGDVLLEIPGLKWQVGPGSTIASVAAVQAVMTEAVGWMIEQGYEPAVRVSRNLPGGDAHNDALAKQYQIRIPELG
jgi:uncharacterized phosphosugar-binding protein